MVTLPRILIAGTHSGVGKTTVAVGVMAALAENHMAVQPFKVGPDYIDPSYHTLVTGRPSHNLDTWLLKKEWIQGVFQAAAPRDGISVIEGVMGFFDGHSVTGSRGSTAELAKWLRVPVILVVDAKGMARSAAAMVQGYRDFDPDISIAGVIFNNVFEGHYQLLREAVAHDTHVPVLGYLPPDPELAMPQRHLGLVPAQETFARVLERGRLVATVKKTIQLEKIIKIAQDAASLEPVEPPWSLQKNEHSKQSSIVRIGVARDQAFHFYYEENLELLRALGAETVFFSPLQDSDLPDDLDALYLGGGFPEIFAERLEQNASLRHEIKKQIARGIPTYAECGGLMYLVEKIQDLEGHVYEAVGALPGTVRMSRHLQNFGYAELVSRRPNILAGIEDPIKGHEFHYSVWDYTIPEGQAAYTVTGRTGKQRLEGLALRNILASYIHVHFLTNQLWARGFVSSARNRKNRKASLVTGG